MWGLYDWYFDKWIDRGIETQAKARKRMTAYTQGKRSHEANWFRVRVVALREDSDLTFWRKKREEFKASREVRP